MAWLLLTYKLPANGSSPRVAVWREARRFGALPVHRSVVAFPDHEAFRRAVERFRALVAEVGGETPERIVACDVHDAPGAQEARGAVMAKEALERYSAAVFASNGL